MRNLYLIRHAKSSWDTPGLRDFNRPLNERGLHDAPRMAKLLAKEGVQPDLIISSPAKRALTTALFFAEAFGMPEEQVAREQDIYEASVRDLLRVISALPDAAHTVLLFGHNNTLTDVANLFTEDFIENVPTCGIVRIESGAPTWREFYEGNSEVRTCFFPKEVL
ncbi:MAG TPA: histidine phosphatase family protein [Saprospiraceae bacterium]|nr:histidine phosphatase family protein [Saprospiraceae bacterium]HND89072.1 histidine phosphatase family protein [Saprospiraceae bacterium]